MAGSLSSMAAEVLAQIQEVFTARQQLGHGRDPAIDLVEVVLKAKEQQIVLHGVGREGLMMRALAMRLYHLGLKAHCLGDMSCPPVGSGDLLLASAGPGSFSSVDALIATAKKAGATVAVITAQPEGNAASLADLTIWLVAQTMADVEAAGDTTGGKDSTSQAAEKRIMPMGSVYEGAMFVLFEIVVYMLRQQLGETVDSMRGRHTNLE